MIKLKKLSATQWNGNGFGTSTAEWCVKDAENILVYKLGFCWVAADISHGMNRIVCRGETRADLLEIMEAKEIV
tara:strand:- start:757 stop:978 length:222 start_codon:yes stop_codon:yes gene_type:complete